MSGDLTRPLTAADINRHFSCPVCQGYFRNPHVQICCFVTYCRDCLVRAMCSKGSHCPTPECQRYMGVKLSHLARPDNQLQAIMFALLPQVFAEERQREREFYAARQTDSYALADIQKSSLNPPPSPAMRRHAGRAAGFSSASRTGALAEKMIVLCVRREHRTGELHLPHLALPYFKLKRYTKVSEMAAIISALLAAMTGLQAQAMGTSEDPGKFDNKCQAMPIDLYCMDERLSASHNLYFVERTKWAGQKLPLVLQYARASSSQKEFERVAELMQQELPR